MTLRLLTIFLIFLAALPQFAVAQSVERTMYVCLYRAPQSMPGSMATPAFQGLAVSTDRGYNWYNRGWKTSTSSSIVRHANDDQLLFLANDYGVLRSSDNGISWKLVTKWNFPTPLSLTFAGERLWAGTTEGPYYTDDQGGTWVFAGEELPKLNARYIACIISTPSDTSARPSSLIAATADGIWKISSNGQSWQPLALRGNNIDRIALHPAKPEIMAAIGNGGGFWLSIDAGASWSDRSSGMQSQILQCVAFDPHSEGSLLVGTRDMGLLKSTDLGSTWNIASGGLSNFYITAVTFDPDLKGVVFAGAVSGTFVSENYGDSWHPFSIRKGYVSEIRIY